MKKKLLAVTLTLSMISVPFSVYAEDASVDANTLLEQMAEFEKNTDSMSGKMTMNLDGALNMTSGEDDEALSLTLNGDYDVKMINQPVKMAITGDMDMSFLGEAAKMNMETYLTLNEDGSTADTYTNVTANGDASGWIHSQTDLAEMLGQFGVSTFEELRGMSFNQLLGDDVQLDWTVTETGDNYELSASLNFSDFMPIIQAALEATGEEIDEATLGIVSTVLDSFKMNLSYTMDKETSAPIAVHMDMNDTDLSTINALVGMFLGSMVGAGDDSASVNAEVVLNDFSVDATYSFNDVSEITIPEEALSAEVIDMQDLVAQAQDGAASN
ncbi:MAG: hypothetical protein Q4B57_05670 [Eubacteriales bacterium]|nr:hypothetical protein [Eubacteriales bacterium]